MVESSSVRVVSLDVWETMLFENDGFDVERHRIRCSSLSRVLGEFGFAVSMEKMENILDSMHPWFKDVWGRNEDVTHLDQLKFIAKAASGSEMREEWAASLSRAYTSAFYELPPALNPDTLPLLRWLKNRGIRIGIISNTGRTPGFVLRDFLERQDMAGFFETMVFSDEVGVRKPNPRIFHLLAEKLSTDPIEIIHIGDSLRSDVWGAKNLGMMALHFSSGRDIFSQIDPKSIAPLEERWEASDPRAKKPEATITSLVDTIEVIRQITHG
jgi:putative hydrolase of the HAD superfamily